MTSNDDDGRQSRSEWVCLPDEAGQCITCSDEALPAKVLRVDFDRYMALVALQGSAEELEVDISLVELVECGDRLLVHGGVALERLPVEADQQAAMFGG